ncbi:MAG: ATP synthase subunit I [Sulfuricella denitrificans]|nr:ATP synthase subunit I [Sulfuricella denitrificans]
MIFQAMVAAASASAAYLLMGKAAAAAVLLGGFVALSNTTLLAWRMRTSSREAVQEPRLELARLVRSSLERFFVVVLLLAAGLGWLKMMPLPLLAGFALGQLTLVVSTIISGIEK